MISLIEAIPDDFLVRPTPCERYSVGALLDHVADSARVLAAAAIKEPCDPSPSADAANLGSDWRTRIAADVSAMADAWCRPDAWTGMTDVGSLQLPAEFAGTIALDELIIHGWDLAKATGLPAGYDGPELEAVYALLQNVRSGGIEGLFGPVVAVPSGASPLDTVVGLAGRDPSWLPRLPVS
jgi:uncharacterized protein (TIGR03086 family)